MAWTIGRTRTRLLTRQYYKSRYRIVYFVTFIYLRRFVVLGDEGQFPFLTERNQPDFIALPHVCSWIMSQFDPAHFHLSKSLLILPPLFSTAPEPLRSAALSARSLGILAFSSFAPITTSTPLLFLIPVVFNYLRL